MVYALDRKLTGEMIQEYYKVKPKVRELLDSEETTDGGRCVARGSGFVLIEYLIEVPQEHDLPGFASPRPMYLVKTLLRGRYADPKTTQEKYKNGTLKIIGGGTVRYMGVASHPGYILTSRLLYVTSPIIDLVPDILEYTKRE